MEAIINWIKSLWTTFLSLFRKRHRTVSIGFKFTTPKEQ